MKLLPCLVILLIGFAACTPRVDVRRTAKPAVTSTLKDLGRPPVKILSRTQWKAGAPLWTLIPHTPERITIHHTGAKQKPNLGLVEKMQGLQRFSQRDEILASGQPKRAWPDVPYHFVIAASGKVAEGREIGYVGDTNTEYDPTGHLLITLEGSFGSEEPTAAQLKTMRLMVKWLAKKYDISADKIGAHKDFAKTGCPGENLYKRIPELRAMIE